MGFLQLIPADKLSATYDPKKHELILAAQGTVQDATSGITFSRQTWAGGLKFNLQGWVGPLTGSQSKYTHEQKFNISLPNPVYPSGDVVIVTQNYPRGKVIAINWLGKTSKVDSNTESASANGSTDVQKNESNMLMAEDQNLTEFIDIPFTIQQSANVPQYGSVDVQFDTDFLSLQTAGVQASNIVWKFKPIKTGITQVVVLVNGGIAPFVMSVSYNVTILPASNTTGV